MTIFSKKRRAEKPPSLTLIFTRNGEQSGSLSELFSVAETVEAMRRIAAGTAGWHDYFVVLRAWAQRFYRSIVFIWRGLGYLLYRARVAIVAAKAKKGSGDNEG